MPTMSAFLSAQKSRTDKCAASERHSSHRPDERRGATHARVYVMHLACHTIGSALTLLTACLFHTYCVAYAACSMKTENVNSTADQ